MEPGKVEVQKPNVLYQVAAPQGSYILELDNERAFISQNISLPISKIKLNLSFYYSPRPGYGAQRLDVYWNNNKVLRVAESGSVNRVSFVQRSVIVNSIYGINNLTFFRNSSRCDNNNCGGNLLDSISLVKISCPDTDSSCDSINDNLEDSCVNNQTIMSLYQQTNSHIKLWNVGYLPRERVCYDTIFGNNFLGGTPHSCIGDENNPDNVVLWLNNYNNSHASTVKVASYETPVCYGDLSCHPVDTSAGESCNSNERVVVSLSGRRNAHISLREDYPIKICCSSIRFELTESFWGDMNKNPITSSDLNDYVKLIVRGANLESETINYSIYEVGGGFLFLDRRVAQVSSSGFLEWRAGQVGNELEAGDYYFIANIPRDEIDSRTNEDGSENPYGVLTVSDEETNTLPVAGITSPLDRQIYFLNEPLNFSQNSYDEDDRFNFAWNFGNGEILTGNSSNLSDFNYSYNTPGQKNIVLNVTDERGLSHADRISILIVASSYVLAYINTPLFGETYRRSVDFDARGSYSVQVEDFGDCEKRITCLAGNCPAQTAGCPSCYAGNALNCPIPVANSNQPFSNLNFDWIFKRGEQEISRLRRTANGDEGAVFSRVFPTIGFYTAELSVSLISSISTEVLSTNNVEFRVSFPNPTCFLVDDENDQRFIPGSNIGDSYWVSENSIIDSTDSCYDADGIDELGDSRTECCPFGYSCNTDSNLCVPVQEDSCQDYTTEDECLDDDGHPELASRELDNMVGQNFPGGCSYNDLYGQLCTQYISCRCEWNTIENVEGCRAVAQHKIATNDDPPPEHIWNVDNSDDSDYPEINAICISNEQPLIGRCNFEFTYEGNCLEGNEFIQRSWTANYESSAASVTTPDYCTDGNDVISCEKSVRLPFFTALNLITIILILIIFYYFRIKAINIKTHKQNI